MKTIRIYVVQVGAVVLTLTQICLAQQIEQPNPIGDHETSVERSSASPVRKSGGDSDDLWRMVNHNGNWWYYDPNGNWSSWNGTRWIPYQPTTQKTQSKGPGAAGRESGDVEVSGARLGLGVGVSPNSGLSNNPAAVINGKGGIGGTKGGAGVPRVGNTVH